MIKQMDHFGAGGAEPRGSGTPSAEHPMLSGQVKNAVDGALRMMEREQAANSPMPKAILNTHALTLEAHVDRRKKLAAQIRAENPYIAEEDIEARLEQFGA